MRRTSLALLAAAALTAGCQPSADAPVEAPAAVARSAPAPVMPVDAPPQEEIDAALAAAPSGSCLAERGEAVAVRLVERCVAVSPASHPPCHPDNPCALIQGEIDRSCAMYGPGESRPAECAA